MLSKCFFGASFRAGLVVGIALVPVLMMTYTNWGADSLWLQLTERLFLMEYVKWRPKKWTGEKRKCKNGFGIICDFILGVEEEASLDLGIYYMCIQEIWMISQPIRYVDFEAVRCDTLYGAVWAGWQWDGSWLAQGLLYHETLLLREEAVLQSLLWLTSLHNPDALLHIQTRTIFRKPLSSPACELCLGIPAFLMICMRSAFFLRFWRETLWGFPAFWLMNLWNPSKWCFQVFLYNRLSFRFVFIVSLLSRRKKSVNIVKFGKWKILLGVGTCLTLQRSGCWRFKFLHLFFLCDFGSNHLSFAYLILPHLESGDNSASPSFQGCFWNLYEGI